METNIEVDELMNIVFDIKEKITSNEYQELMRLLMETNNKMRTLKSIIDGYSETVKAFTVLAKKEVIETHEVRYRRICRLCHQMYYTPDQYIAVCSMCEL